jgi:pimeloyl-ACP methyl ester carboxylesterase
VIYDLRGHGENLYQGKDRKPLRLGRRQICTFSRKESMDLMKVIEDTRNRFGKDILLGLHGESLGAATTVATLGHKPDVAFAVEDCGFADIVNVQKVGLKFLHIPQFMVYPASVMSVLINGYSFTSTRPVDAVADNEVPLLVIHGEADDFILLDNAKRIYDAQKGFKRMETFPGAGHAGSLGSDPIRYERIVNDFLDSIGC